MKEIEKIPQFIAKALRSGEIKFTNDAEVIRSAVYIKSLQERMDIVARETRAELFTRNLEGNFDTDGLTVTVTFSFKREYQADSEVSALDAEIAKLDAQIKELKKKRTARLRKVEFSHAGLDKVQLK